MIPNSSLLIRRDLKKNERTAAFGIKEKRIFLPKTIPSNRQAISVMFVFMCLQTVTHGEPTSPSPSFLCGPGERFKPGDGTHKDRCLLCPKGNYQDQKHHRLQTCENCSIINDWGSYRIQLDECTRFHDVVVKCMPLFYLDGQKGCFYCQNCTKRGKFWGQACGDTNDAVCCNTEDEIVKDGKCVDPKDFCPPGEFLVGNQTCLSCDDCKPCINQTTDLTRDNHTCNCTQSPDSNTTGSLSTGGVVGLVFGFLGIAIIFFFLGKYWHEILGCLRKTLSWAKKKGIFKQQPQNEEPQNDGNSAMSHMLNPVTGDS